MTRNQNFLRYALLVGFVLLLALAGYVLYPRFDLPAVTGASLLLLAAAAGVASFFTPCSFPLLTTLLARAIDSEDERSPLARAVRYGTALAIGSGIFLLLLGIGIALGAGALFEQVKFTSTPGRILRLILGTLLILFGLIQIERFSLPFDRLTSLTTPIRKVQRHIREEYPTVGFALFGFSYILAGFV